MAQIALLRQVTQVLDEFNFKTGRIHEIDISLDECIGCGCLSLKSCPLYNSEDHLAKQGPGPVLLDKD